MYIKKGYQTEECLRARNDLTQKRRQNGNENYKRKFETLGIEGFDYLRREWSTAKDTRFWVRCKKCGRELLRSNDILRGRTKRLECRVCGNGIECRSKFADEVLTYYSQHHTMLETCEKFGITKTKLSEWVKARGVTNGRSLSEINKEKGSKGARIRAKQMKAKVEQRLAYELNVLGFDYLGGYDGKKSRVKTKCQKCGEVVERVAAGILKDGATCRNCRRIEAEKLAREKEIKKKQREALRALINPLGLSAYQLEKERKLDEVHTCKVCGRQYTVRQYMESCGLSLYSDAGYCSKTCKYLRTRSKANESRKKHPRENKNHYDRARKLGLPRDRGITLRKLIERDGLYCAICGMACIYSGDSKSDLYPSIDHIIPMKKGGGHTWDNVQVAHRICNSIKGAKIGEEYGNVKKENN